MFLFLVFTLLGRARAYYSYHGSFTTTHPHYHSSTSLLAEQQEQTTPLYFEQNTIALNQQIGRSLSFYSGILPIFLKYRALSVRLKANPVTPEEEERLYNEIHEWGSEIVVKKVKELKGFYVKAGQIISTRVDIFPEQYTSKLAMTQDKLDPLPGQIIKDIVRQELLHGAELSELFLSFDDECLGSASIAQVHKATLLDGRTVAVKVQKPDIEGRFLGDLRNIKFFAKMAGDSLLIDYYKIFVEVEKTAKLELDFLFEAQATIKVASAVAHSPSNKPRKSPVIVPMPISGLVTRRVMVLEYVDGIPLSKMAAEMKTRGVTAGSLESKVLGVRLLTALSNAYSSMIFGSGIVHGDPHPGNIFVMEDGGVALLDCGQVKQINTKQRLGLARMIILVKKWEQTDQVLREATKKGGGEESVGVLKRELENLTAQLASLVGEAGVTLKEGATADAAAAVAILLFGNTETVLPGGYAGEEVSPNSPIVQVAEFPSEYILLGRATVMMKGIAKRLGVTWGMSDKWAKDAAEVVALLEDSAMVPTSATAKSSSVDILPIWAVTHSFVPTTAAEMNTPSANSNSNSNSNKQLRFSDVLAGFYSMFKLLGEYLRSKALRLAKKWLPDRVKTSLLRLWAKFQTVS